MPKKVVMEEFTIQEISAVDLPAQAGAQAKIIKNKGGREVPDEFSKALKEMGAVDTIAKRYYDPAEGAVSFGAVLTEEMKCRNYYEIMEQVGPFICAMETSLRSIAGDASIESLTKLSMMRNTVEDFMGSIRNVWSGADEFMMSALNKFLEGEGNMPRTLDDYKKANAELEGAVSKLTEDLAATKTELEAAKSKGGTKKDKAGNESEAVAALEKKVAELSESLQKAEDARKAAEELSKMSAAEKEYMNSLKTDKERKEFMGMSAAERKGRMKKSEDGDEVIKVDGVGEIRKSAVGETQFAIFKSQQERLERAEKAAATEREERQTAVYKNRIEKSMNNLPGTVDEKVTALKSLSSLDHDTQVVIEKMLDAGEKAIAAGFVRFGVNDSRPDLHTKSSSAHSVAKSKFMGHVSAIQKRDSCSRTEAMTKARLEHAEDFESYNAEQ